MTIAYIRPINPPGDLALVEIIALSPGSPPPRPHPSPEPPVVEPPIVLPPEPTHPIEIPRPPAGTLPPDATNIHGAIVAKIPASGEAVPPGMPPDSIEAMIWFGPGTLPTKIWVPPYAATTPKP